MKLKNIFLIIFIIYNFLFMSCIDIYEETIETHKKAFNFILNKQLKRHNKQDYIDTKILNLIPSLTDEYVIKNMIELSSDNKLTLPVSPYRFSHIILANLDESQYYPKYYYIAFFFNNANIKLSKDNKTGECELKGYINLFFSSDNTIINFDMIATPLKCNNKNNNNNNNIVLYENLDKIISNNVNHALKQNMQYYSTFINSVIRKNKSELTHLINNDEKIFSKLLIENLKNINNSFYSITYKLFNNYEKRYLKKNTIAGYTVDFEHFVGLIDKHKNAKKLILFKANKISISVFFDIKGQIKNKKTKILIKNLLFYDKSQSDLNLLEKNLNSINDIPILSCNFFERRKLKKIIYSSIKSIITDKFFKEFEEIIKLDFHIKKVIQNNRIDIRSVVKTK